MRIMSICDNIDICTGLKLVGIEGVTVDSPEEFIRALSDVLAGNLKDTSGSKVDIVVVAKKYTNFAEEILKGSMAPVIVEVS